MIIMMIMIAIMIAIMIVIIILVNDCSTYLFVTMIIMMIGIIIYSKI